MKKKTERERNVGKGDSLRKWWMWMRKQEHQTLRTKRQENAHTTLPGEIVLFRFLFFFYYIDAIDHHSLSPSSCPKQSQHSLESK
jgi:hypothetical protein